jgi:hypothetical protein
MGSSYETGVSECFGGNNKYFAQLVHILRVQINTWVGNTLISKDVASWRKLVECHVEASI